MDRPAALSESMLSVALNFQRTCFRQSFGTPTRVWGVMGLFDLFRSLFFGDRPIAAPATEAPATQRSNDRETPSLVTGSVSYVGPKFYKIQLADGRIGHVGGHHVPRERTDVSSHYQCGDRVKVVVLGPSNHKRGEHICSETLVEEMIRRADLSRLSVGDEVEVQVRRLTPDRTYVTHGRAEGFIPRERVAGGPPGKRALIAGQVTKVRVDWIEMPELRDSLPPSKLHSSFGASLRPEPVQPVQRVLWDVGAVACRMKVDVRLPREVDVICQWCLARMADGADCATLTTQTGLPPGSVQAIADLLTEHGLVQPGCWAPTQRGRSLLAALAKAAEAKEHPVRFLFASAMPPDMCFLPATTESAERSSGAPPAVKDTAQEQRLRADASGALRSLRAALPDVCPESMLEALQDRWLRVSLRVERHAAPVTLPVPLSFLTEALHRYFASAEQEPPQRVPQQRMHARVLLLVRLRVTLVTRKHAVGADEASPEWLDEEVFLERASGTLWRSDPAKGARMQPVPGGNLPVLPLDFARRLAFTGTLVEVQPLDWRKAIFHGTRSTSIPVENGRDHGEGRRRDSFEGSRPRGPDGSAGGGVGRARRGSGGAGLQRHEGADHRSARGDRSPGATTGPGA